MKKNATCWRCNEVFVPDRIWDINGREICWHECEDGMITQVTLKDGKGPRPILARKQRSLD